MDTTGRNIFTVGYATHSLAEFIGLLQRHGVTAVADVRSQPYSRVPEFNRESLKVALRSSGIEYVFLGRELGARREEREAYETGGRASYERIAGLPAFREGIERLEQGATRDTIALMCAEKNPVDCHRTVLVCRHLRRLGFNIQHILADGTVEQHDTTEQRLVEITNNTACLFDHAMPPAERIERAYDARGKEIAYRRSPEGALS